MAKKMVKKGSLTPMQRVERFQKRRAKVAAGRPTVDVQNKTPKMASHVVNQVSVDHVVGGATPKTIALWVEQMMTKIEKAVMRGEFDRAVTLIREVERRGVDYDPERDVEVGIDDFLSAYFDLHMSSAFARNGVLTFRQLLQFRSEELLQLDGIGQGYAEKATTFCRANFHWQDGRLSTGPRDGYRPASNLPVGEKRRVNRGFVE